MKPALPASAPPGGGSASAIPGGAGSENTGLHSASTLVRSDIAHRIPRLVVSRATGHEPGMIYDLDDELVLGRGEHAEIRLEDPFASSRHARIYGQAGTLVLEDLRSTNGTYLNEELLDTPPPPAPRRSPADRRERIRVRGGLRRCCA